MLSASAYSFRQKSRLAISLTWIAGYTNVIAFLMLAKVVVSHVTGNVTHFGLAVAEWATQRNPAAGAEVAYFGFVVLTFFCGAVASAVMTEGARRLGVTSKYILPMAVEAVLLSALAIGTDLHVMGVISASDAVHRFWLTGVAAFAMGLQNATITKISGAVIRTTHLTGVVTDLGLEGVQYLLWAWDKSRGGRGAKGVEQRSSRFGRVLRVSRRQPSVLRIALLCSIFGSFLFGAVAGTLIFLNWPTLALIVPVAFLLFIIGVDWRKPIADVRELDASSEFGSIDAIQAILPPEMGLYRLTHPRRTHAHHAPDFQLWVERLPKHWRVVLLAVSPLTHFDAESVLDLSAAVQRLRNDHRDLILCGVKPHQYRAFAKGGLFELLGRENVSSDFEIAIARGLNRVHELMHPAPPDAGA